MFVRTGRPYSVEGLDESLPKGKISKLRAETYTYETGLTFQKAEKVLLSEETACAKA